MVGFWNASMMVIVLPEPSRPLSSSGWIE